MLSRPATGLGAPDPPFRRVPAGFRARKRVLVSGFRLPPPPPGRAFRREYRTLLFENISVRFRARKGISVSCGRNVT